MSVTIHPTALVAPGAQLGEGVRVGAYTVIDGEVEIGAGTHIGHHCVVTGRTRIGRDNRIFHFVSLGEANQDKKYAGEPTRLAIGDRNTIREYCSLNRGTVQDKGVTTVGDDNWLMAYVHVAHDCIVGNRTTIANCTQLAGHVEVGDWATLGGFTGVHQFVKIGAHVMCGVSSVVLMDIPPYVTVGGNPLRAVGVNAEGLKRRDFTPGQVANVKRAFKTLYKSDLAFAEARDALAREGAAAPEIKVLSDFLAGVTRGIVR
ncbi:MAG: acyl-ACP--UDP-N-acetylglucosamine O-acyltransferase [Betaproteobacteria bacterium]|nr:acyl-ACP--UDP-N-acetylglucosamine O-acyltransferase [Betaproteobacteria bacterium]